MMLSFDFFDATRRFSFDEEERRFFCLRLFFHLHFISLIARLS